jgi:hypothetical protein
MSRNIDPSGADPRIPTSLGYNNLSGMFAMAPTP